MVIIYIPPEVASETTSERKKAQCYHLLVGSLDPYFVEKKWGGDFFSHHLDFADRQHSWFKLQGFRYWKINFIILSSIKTIKVPFFSSSPISFYIKSVRHLFLPFFISPTHSIFAWGSTVQHWNWNLESLKSEIEIGIFDFIMNKKKNQNIFKTKNIISNFNKLINNIKNVISNFIKKN